MILPVPETHGSIGPWQRYVARERAARNTYIEVTKRAHQEYLIGPWPDRPAYEHVERDAWLTYYAAGRDAWRTYVQELGTPGPAVARMPEHKTIETISGPYQTMHPYDHPQPVFHPTEESDH